MLASVNKIAKMPIFGVPRRIAKIVISIPHYGFAFQAKSKFLSQSADGKFSPVPPMRKMRSSRHFFVTAAIITEEFKYNNNFAAISFF